MRIFQAVLWAGLAVAPLIAENIMRVSEVVARRAVVVKVDPRYPFIARQLHLTGRVTVDVYVDEDGRVERVQPLTGNQHLTAAAVSAVKKWRFLPFDRKAVATLAFDFKP